MAEYLFRRRHQPRWPWGRTPPDTELAASGFQSQPRPARRWAQFGVLLLASIAVAEPLPPGRPDPDTKPIVRAWPAALRTWLSSVPPAESAVQELPEGTVRLYGRGDVVPRRVLNVRIGGGAGDAGVALTAPPSRGYVQVPVPARRTKAALLFPFVGVPPPDAAAAEALPEGQPRFQDRIWRSDTTALRVRIGGGVGADAQPEGSIQFPDRLAARRPNAPFVFPSPPGAENIPEGRFQFRDRAFGRSAPIPFLFPTPAGPDSTEPLPEGTVRFYGRADVRPRVVPNVRIGGGASTGDVSITPPSRGFVQVPPFPRRSRAPFVFLRVAVPPDVVAAEDLPAGVVLASLPTARLHRPGPAVLSRPPFDPALVPLDVAALGLPAMLDVVFHLGVGAAHSWVLGYPPIEAVAGEDVPAGVGFQAHFARGTKRLYGLPLLIGRSPFEGVEVPPLAGLLPAQARGRARAYGQPILLAHPPAEEVEVPAGVGYFEARWGGWLGARRAAPSAYWTLPIFVPPDDFVPPPEPSPLPVGDDIRGSRWNDITGQMWDDIRGSRWLDSND